jgi:hypothetical protein
LNSNLLRLTEEKLGKKTTKVICKKKESKNKKCFSIAKSLPNDQIKELMKIINLFIFGGKEKRLCLVLKNKSKKEHKIGGCV